LPSLLPLSLPSLLPFSLLLLYIPSSILSLSLSIPIYFPPFLSSLLTFYFSSSSHHLYRNGEEGNGVRKKEKGEGEVFQDPPILLQPLRQKRTRKTICKVSERVGSITRPQIFKMTYNNFPVIIETCKCRT